MGIIVQFLASHEHATAITDGTEVASISINSLASGAAFEALSNSPLFLLVGDATVGQRQVRVYRREYPTLWAFAQRLHDESAPGSMLRDLANAIMDAVDEAGWRRADLWVVAA